ncbi:serine/threonine-protein kinase DCLK3 [Amia ocellicauda]|uniref:serine/threonine-protein kinase DCLK3 n=1 Tax=Amia ocellicauda TaxID=2972642 RepID=UPI003464C957
MKDPVQRNSDARIQASYPPMDCSTFSKSLSGPTCFNKQHGGFHTIHAENSPVKPRIVTVVKPGGRRHLRKITLLLNRRSVQTFEQLIADISEALGFPQWKNDRVKKLFSLKGREIRSVSDFFRGDDIFVAAGREKLTLKDVQEVLEELYPDSPYSQSVVQQNWERLHKPQAKVYDKGSKADSGFHEEPEVAKQQKGANPPKQPATNLQRVRDKAHVEERLRARKWERERWERHQRESERRIVKDEDIEKCNEVDSQTARHCEKCKRNLQRMEQGRLTRGRDVSPGKGGPRKEEFYSESQQSEPRKLKQRESKNVLNHQKRTVGRVDEKKSGKENSWRAKDPEDVSVFRGQGIAEQKEVLKEDKLDVENETSRDLCDSDTKGDKLGKPHHYSPSNLVEMKSSPMPIEGRHGSAAADTHQGKREEKGQDEIEARTREVSEQQEKSETGKPPESEKQQSSSCNERPRVLKTWSDIESYYEIGRVIGDGNFAVVKECKLRNTDCAYAMKIIDKAKLKGKEHMIKNEISIIKSLSHPNIVKLLQDYETEGDIYLIMEFVHGGDLFDAITESVKFTEHNASLMVNDLCQALAYIHGKSIVHRDLKPENLLVQHNEDGSTTLKLADFGLAMVVTEPIFTVCGTPTYVAPEILSEKGYSVPVDMWATGVIVYILLCGFPPFRSLERDQEELFEIIQLGEYEFLPPYWDNISDGSKDLISKLLQVDPEKRYTAAQALQHPWVKAGGKKNSCNLQREVTVNIERHFKNHRRREHASAAQH